MLSSAKKEEQKEDQKSNEISIPIPQGARPRSKKFIQFNFNYY